jgi:iron complex outermembrane receptor protein
MDFATSWLDFMKLRLGYGVAGSQEAIDPYMSLQRLGIPSDPTEGGGSYYDSETQTWKISYIPVSNANPDLKWETTSQTNLS